MGEVVNIVVAFAVIVLLVRWATREGSRGGEETRRARDLLGFRPKNVTLDMTTTVQSMFPHVPRDNIHYDLLKTGNIQVTSDKILERGFLDAPPPAYFQLFPTQPPVAPGSARQAPTTTISSSTATPKLNLISRYDLQDRLRSEAEVSTTATDAGGKAAWEDTAEMREASLRERKAKMVLAARKRILEQEAANVSAA